MILKESRPHRLQLAHPRRLAGRLNRGKNARPEQQINEIKGHEAEETDGRGAHPSFDRGEAVFFSAGRRPVAPPKSRLADRPPQRSRRLSARPTPKTHPTVSNLPALQVTPTLYIPPFLSLLSRLYKQKLKKSSISTENCGILIKTTSYQTKN